MGTVRPTARLYVGIVATAAVVALLLAVARMPTPDLGTTVLATAFAACLAIAWSFPLHFGFKLKITVGTAVAFAALLLLPPGLAILVAMMGQLATYALQRRRPDWFELGINTSIAILEVGAAELVLVAAGWNPAEPTFDQPLHWAAMAGAALAMYLVNTVLSAIAVALLTGMSALTVWLESGVYRDRIGVLSHLALLGLGLLAAVIADTHPWGLLLLIPPLAAIFVMLRSQLRLRLQAEEALRGSEASLAEAQRIARLGSWNWDLATGRHLWSDETYRVLGYEPQTFAATHDVFLSCVHPDDRHHVETTLRDALRRGGPYAVDHRILRPDGAERMVHTQGEVLTDEPDRPLSVVGTLHDVTERRALEAQLAHRAFHDVLTDLPNRARFDERLDQAVARMTVDRAIAVMFIDLDGFKLVNDGFGHEAGDRLLIEVANRLRARIRPGDTAARFGGDEFTVLLEGLTDEREAITIAERIAEALRRPYHLGRQEAALSASVGIAVGVAGGTRTGDLLRDADAALYRAKAAGKDAVVLFEPRMTAGAAHRLGLRSELSRAVERGELRLRYQPQVDLASGQVVALESLIRWQHPVHGLIPPEGFVPLAEESGLILPLGEWVLREACRQTAAWHLLRPSAPPVRVAVNLSLRQIREGGLPGQVEAILRETGLDPRWLELEITEHVLAAEPDAVGGVLKELRGLGVRLALDDFGTGYSALASLRDLEIDTVKLDRSLVRGLAADPRGLAIAEAVAGLAQRLGMTVTAEGIETPDEVVRVRAVGCDAGQGYYFAPPLTSAETGDLLGQAAPFNVFPNVVPALPSGASRRRLGRD